MVRKYGGLRWLDPDNHYCVCEAHPDKMFFEKKKGNNKYLVFATYRGFDLNKPLDKQHALYDGWQKTWADLYEEIVTYYKDSHEVKCYIEGGACSSEEDGDADEGED